MATHPYREATSPPLRAPCDEGPDWGLTAPLAALFFLCSTRVALAFLHRERFDTEPSLALLVAFVMARLIWGDMTDRARVAGAQATGKVRVKVEP